MHHNTFRHGCNVINEDGTLHQFVCERCGGSKLSFHKWVRCREEVIFTEDGRIEYGPPVADEKDDLGLHHGFICRQCERLLEHQGQHVETEADLKVYLSMDPNKIAADNEAYDNMVFGQDDDDEDGQYYPDEDYYTCHDEEDASAPPQKHEPVKNNFSCSKCGSSRIRHEKWVQCREHAEIGSEGNVTYGPPEIDEEMDLEGLFDYVCGDCGTSIELCSLSIDSEYHLEWLLGCSPDERRELQEKYEQDLIDWAEATMDESQEELNDYPEKEEEKQDAG